jgi:hypothetical protein
MKRRISSFAILALALSGSIFLKGQDTPTPLGSPATTISTIASQDYPQVTCTTSDTAACAETLQMATDTREQLAALLKLGSTWRFPVHIHVLTPDDPLTAKINREAAAVFAQGNTMRIEAVLPSTDPDAREFVQRQVITALLWEKFFANTTSFDKHTPLDIVPLWLVEGLREWLKDDPEHTRASIVRRAVQNQSAPTLAEVTGWHELSDDRLLGLWQRAFSYYLVDSLIQDESHRADFQQWLAGFSSPSASTAQLHFPTETAWQHELADSISRSRNLVYTWSETRDELTTAKTLTFASSKDGKIQSCSIDDAATLPRTPIVLEALQERVIFLTELELRAHPGWHPVLEIYRSSLTALLKENNIEKAKQLLQEAHREFVVESDYHQKLLDYANWFEVTKDDGNNTSHFESYFITAREMERVEADPAHPNPIRANLIQIESEL